jgi:hypothetical protein
MPYGDLLNSLEAACDIDAIFDYEIAMPRIVLTGGFEARKFHSNLFSKTAEAIVLNTMKSPTESAISVGIG